MKTQGSTHANQERRRLAIVKIISQLRKEHKPVNRFTVLPLIRAEGYDVEEGTVYRDLTVINRENTWVRDLVESNYSAYQERIAENLDFMEKEAIENYHKSWTMNKTVKRVVSNEKGNFETIEETITQEMASPKAQFLLILGKVQELRMKHTHGDNINISAALLSAELQDAKDSLQKLSKGDKTPIIDVLELAKKVKLNAHNQQ
jgi:hypothetical protein